MKHLWRTICLMALAPVLLFLSGCQEKTTPPPAPTASTDSFSSSTIVQGGRVTALGTIRPARRLKLSFLAGGPIDAIRVDVGSEVKAGDLLAALDTTELELTVREAEDALAASQALLSQAQTGPMAEAVAVAEAEARRAQAQHEATTALYDQALNRSVPAEVAMAEAGYRAALARYEQVKAGPGEEELAIARAQVQKAELALQRAQAAYDRVAGEADIGARPEAAALQEATVDYELAVAQYERLKRLPTQADLGEAQAEVSRAQAQLQLAQLGPSEEELAASASGLAVVQAQLALAQAAPREVDVAVVEAQVQQAQTTLERARLALTRSELRAPFDGAVSEVYLHAGEWAAPGAPVVELLDTGHWLVETRNISELNIGQVAVGQEAIVRVMAFRGEELRGRVFAISPVAVVQQGDTTYTALIELEPTDLALRPGMNAEVEIVIE